MYVLGIDCATAACSAALYHDGEIVERAYEERERGHAEVLVPMIEQVMSAAGRKMRDVDLFAATVGPGAYTGVRIVLSTAQSLSLAASRPLVGVTTLDAVARAQGERSTAMLVALETKRADIYAQLFNPTAIDTPVAVEEEALAEMFPMEPLLIAGDAAERAAAVFRAAGREVELTGGPRFPDAAWVARIGAENYSEGTVGRAEPMYLRPPDVGPPRKRRP